MNSAMLRVFLSCVLLLTVLFPSALQAAPEVTGIKVVFVGELGKARQGRELAAYPGMRFGMEVIAEGTPKGAHVVLEARLTRPDDPEGTPPLRWLIPARIGYPAQSIWEFAYDWEIQPGVWTMDVASGETVSAPASFTLTQGQPLPQDQAVAQIQDTTLTGQKPRDRSSEKGADKAPTEKPLAGKKQPDKPSVERVLTEKPTKGASGTTRVGASPQQRLFVLMGGSFSEEGRAMWMAALLKGQGIKACVRGYQRDGRKFWGVVLGWKETLEEARKAKEELSRKAPEVLVVGMTAAELEKGLACR